MSKLRDNIPNAITALNLLCGAVSIIMATSGMLVMASWFLLIAALFDFADGFAARLLHAKSEIGAQLDSLADVISFGLAPAIIFFVLIGRAMPYDLLTDGFHPMPFISLLIVIASAYRLARFNIEPGQQDRFSGLPTPAMGIFVAALPLAIEQYSDNDFVLSILGNPYILLTSALVLSWLMVSRVPVMSMKVKNLRWKDNSYRYILVAISICLVSFFGFAGIPVAITFYVTLSLFDRQ